MEKRSSHYKMSHAQFVLISCGLNQIHAMYIGSCKSGTKHSWHAEICDKTHYNS